MGEDSCDWFTWAFEPTRNILLPLTSQQPSSQFGWPSKNLHDVATLTPQQLSSQHHMDGWTQSPFIEISSPHSSPVQYSCKQAQVVPLTYARQCNSLKLYKKPTPYSVDHLPSVLPSHHHTVDHSSSSKSSESRHCHSLSSKLP